MAINKVVMNTVGGESVLIDLTEDTVTEDDVAAGVVFHNAAGERKIGSRRQTPTTAGEIEGLQEFVQATVDDSFFVVTFDMGDDGKYHGNLTFAEIREKFEAGGNMVARIDGTDYIPLLSAASHQIIFSGIYQANSVALTVNSNDVCNLSATSLARSTHNHSFASKTSNGFMTSTDKTKLDGIERDAEVNVVETIMVDGVKMPVTNKTVNIPVAEKLKELGFLALPRDENGNIQYGEAGQVAVSDGNGGITWMTIA